MNMKWCLALACLLLGCSNGQLDRKTAGKAIDARFSDDVSGIMVYVGKVGSHCASLENDGRQVPEDLTPEKQVEVVVAREAGLLTVTPDGPDYWQLTLTDKGKAAAPDMERLRLHDYHNTLNGCDYRTVMFAVASMEIVKVIGISGEKDTRSVDFEWRWKPTELGVGLRENGSIYQKLGPEQRKMLHVFNLTDVAAVHIPVPSDDAINRNRLPFKKYDDGWRLQAPPKMNERH